MELGKDEGRRSTYIRVLCLSLISLSKSDHNAHMPYAIWRHKWVSQTAPTVCKRHSDTPPQTTLKWAQSREGELVTCNVYKRVDYTALTLRVSPHVALLPHNNSAVIYTHVMTEQRVYPNY